MHTPPFHRRILFAVFIIMFLAFAPAAIFYTAGYRWNPKKGAIERNGTLIVDTTPDGVDIYLNGKKLEERSPLTQQDVAPGSYRIRLALDGYYPWEKTLEVRPERVTFVNDVILWPNVSPEKVVNAASRMISVSPNGKFFAYVRERNGDMGVTVREISTNEESEFSFSTSTFDGSGKIVWNSASTAAYVEDAAGRAWIVQRTRRDVVALPAGAYRWSGNDLVGVTAGGRYTYNVSRGTTTRNALAPGVIDEEGGYDVFRATTSSEYVLRDQSLPNRHYQLPRGSWTFMEAPGGLLALTNGASAFLFSSSGDPTDGTLVPSDGVLRVVRADGAEKMIAVLQNEVWLLGADVEEVLLRKSEPIIGVEWHRLGRDVFYATTNNVISLNLDQRDGRIETPLAHFDEIFGLAYARRELFVSARQGESVGVWSIAIE